MTSKRTFAVASLVATVGLTALGFGAASNAQVPPRPGPPAADARPAPPTRAQMEQRMAERRAQRTNDLATVLRLTPAQRPALNAYVASQTPPRRDPAAGPANRQAPGAMTPQQRLDERAKRVTERQAFATRRADALRTFTATLTPEQRQVFDAFNRLRASDGRGRGGHRFGGPGHRDGGKGMRGPGRFGGPDGRGDRRGPGGPGAPPPPVR